jgi:DEAD/DEAH box helicase domain-containing protein
MPSIEQFTARLVNQPPPGSRVRAHLILPPAAPPPGPACATYLPAWLASMLQVHGIEHLTDYQEYALRLVDQRQHVCLAAPSGAGRGVLRLLALYRSLGAERRGHALGIFPQKHRELAQFKTVTAWNHGLPPEHRLSAAIYDGDTPKAQRRTIKQSPPHLLLTTPEMLHAGILAYHGGWRAFFEDLCYVVLADLHLCTGALGAHLALLWRRLHRLSRHYGANPQYLITSAPLGNMPEVTKALTGHPCAVVSGATWRRQPQSRVILEVAGDTATVVSELVARLSEADLRPLLLGPNSDDVSSTPQTADRPPHTSVVLLGVPSSLTGMHEYLARFASYLAPSVSILLLRGETPLERYMLHYPAVYQTPWWQDLPLNPSNPLVARQHLLCAAAELALGAGERFAGLHGLSHLVHQLAADQAIVRHTASRQWVATQSHPHRRVRLRFYEPGVAVVHRHDGRILTILAPEQAFREAFEGAIYQHAGQVFQVERCIADRRRVVVRPTHATYRTRAMVRYRVTDPNIAAAIITETFRLTYGTLNYAQTLYAFERLDVHTQARTSLHALPEQQREFRTHGVWIDFADTPDIHHQDLQTAVHTLVHAVLAGLPVLLMGEGTQVRGGMYERHELGVAGPVAAFIDAQAGGSGASICLYAAYERILRVGLQILLHCDCERHCNRCVAGQRCDTCAGSEPLDRQAGIRLLQKMLGEVSPFLDTVRPLSHTARQQPSPRKHQGLRHIYLCLSTQKSAAEIGGWQHKHLLGLGLAVTYDTQDGRYRVYTAETVEALLQSLQVAGLVIGFNLRDFDYQVLQPYADTPLTDLPTFAILDEMQHVLGFRLSLSHLVQETLGIERPDDSVETLRWFREGARDRIIEHCRRDIGLLRELVRHGARTGSLYYRDRSGARQAAAVQWHSIEHDG